jgi:pyridoxal phosphate enzyme (YggS family)
LQSNKARKAAESFALIHSIDSEALLLKIDQAAAEVGHSLDALVQVDLAGESTKHGASTAAVRAILSAAARCRTVRVVGLMLLPPAFDDPEDSRPYFASLRRLRDELAQEGHGPLPELSMGMSHDFDVAVEEGATLVRIGSAIFGNRPQHLV